MNIVVFDSTNMRVSSWTPRAPASKVVCNLSGQPAIPVRHGGIRRGNRRHARGYRP